VTQAARQVIENTETGKTHKKKLISLAKKGENEGKSE